MHKINVDAQEIEKFSKLSSSWWDPEGPLKPLHQINPKRLEYIRNQIVKHFKLEQNNLKPFAGLNLLDLGCGGGLISEPMARLGAHVTAIDASDKNIGIAKFHAEQVGLNINYLNCLSEDLIKEHNSYDIILALEIIEHVPDPQKFVDDLIKLAKPNALIIISTINRTIKSYMGAIIAAEYLLRWLPVGTHSWQQFLKPSELIGYVRKHNCEIMDISGLSLNPLKWEWIISRDLTINYMISLVKS